MYSKSILIQFNELLLDSTVWFVTTFILKHSSLYQLHHILKDSVVINIILYLSQFLSNKELLPSLL